MWLGVQSAQVADNSAQIVAHARNVHGLENFPVVVVDAFDARVPRIVFGQKILILIDHFHRLYARVAVQCVGVIWIAEVLEERAGQRGFAATRHSRYANHQPGHVDLDAIDKTLFSFVRVII